MLQTPGLSSMDISPSLAQFSYCFVVHPLYFTMLISVCKLIKKKKKKMSNFRSFPVYSTEDISLVSLNLFHLYCITVQKSS